MHDDHDDDPSHPLSAIHRIGREVREHDARLRQVERRTDVLTVELSHMKDTLTSIDSVTKMLDTKLDAHTVKEDRDRNRILTSVWVQFLGVLIMLCLLYLERGG